VIDFDIKKQAYKKKHTHRAGMMKRVSLWVVCNLTALAHVETKRLRGHVGGLKSQLACAFG
jgi:hypothetical protein